MRQMILVIVAFSSACYRADEKLDNALSISSPNQVLSKQREGEIEIAIEQKSDSIQVERLTAEIAKKHQLENRLQIDPGFAKYVLLFKELSGNPPYSIEIKRLANLESSQFAKAIFSEEDTNIELPKIANQPVFCCVSARGFMPGEKVAIRIISSDHQSKEIVFYPRPIFLKKPSGEVLMKATLDIPLCPTYYTVSFCGIPEGESFRVWAESGREYGNFNLKGPVTMGYSPDTFSAQGGFSSLQVNLKDGSSYKMELPWGAELSEYLLGNQ